MPEVEIEAEEWRTHARSRRTPVGAQIAALIRERIAHGSAVGDPLPSEADIAAEFGVSQRAVRDALRILHNQGVVQTQQGKRAVVSELRPVAVEDYFRFAVEAGQGTIDDLMELRLLLEVRVAGLAASRATDEDIARIRQLLAEVIDSGTDLERRAPADVALHDAIARASRNSFFQAILEALSQVLTEERRRGGELMQAVGSNHGESDYQHELLVDAIVARDPVRASAAARYIIERAWRMLGTTSDAVIADDAEAP